MAVFQVNTPHADTHPRRNLTPEDAAFLSALQTTLNTQSTMGNAQPTFWVIKGSEDAPVDVEACDATHLSVDGQLHDVSTPEKILEFLSSDDVADIMASHGVDYHVEADATLHGNALVRANSENDDFEDSIETAEEVHYLLVDVARLSPVDVQPLQIIRRPKIYQDTLFLTHAACQEHLRRYGYNYDHSAHAFAMTAHRSPELEQLLEVVRSVRWDKVATTGRDEPCRD